MKKYSMIAVFLLAGAIHAGAIPRSPSFNEQIRSNLYVIQADTALLLDGTLTQYSASYSNEVDGLDARKISNFSENIGMMRGLTTLVIERRHTIEANDTIFYKIWNLKSAIVYQLNFVTESLNHPGMSGFLEDSYLHKSIPVDLNGITNVNFTVNSDPGSGNTCRFKLIFKTKVPIDRPLTFMDIKTYSEPNAIMLQWKTQNEAETVSYHIERSFDSFSFTKITAIAAKGFTNDSYTWTDFSPIDGIAYYRIGAISFNGEIAYSPIVKIITTKAFIKVFPNPVENNVLKLSFENQPAGRYVIKLIDAYGRLVFKTTLEHSGDKFQKSIEIKQEILKGIYNLKVENTKGESTLIKVVLR